MDCLSCDTMLVLQKLSVWDHFGSGTWRVGMPSLCFSVFQQLSPEPLTECTMVPSPHVRQKYLETVLLLFCYTRSHNILVFSICLQWLTVAMLWKCLRVLSCSVSRDQLLVRMSSLLWKPQRFNAERGRESGGERKRKREREREVEWGREREKVWERDRERERTSRGPSQVGVTLLHSKR